MGGNVCVCVWGGGHGTLGRGALTGGCPNKREYVRRNTPGSANKSSFGSIFEYCRVLVATVLVNVEVLVNVLDGLLAPRRFELRLVRCRCLLS